MGDDAIYAIEMARSENDSTQGSDEAQQIEAISLTTEHAHERSAVIYRGLAGRYPDDIDILLGLVPEILSFALYSIRCDKKS